MTSHKAEGIRQMALSVAPDRRTRQARAASYVRFPDAEPRRPSLGSLTPQQKRLVLALIDAARAEQTAGPTAQEASRAVGDPARR
jgi:hypothetical protein